MREIHRAIDKCDKKRIEKFLEKPGRINQVFDVFNNGHKQTILHFAVYCLNAGLMQEPREESDLVQKRIEIIQLLLDKGGDPFADCESLETPLSLALEVVHIDDTAAKMMIERLRPDEINQHYLTRRQANKDGSLTKVSYPQQVVINCKKEAEAEKTIEILNLLHAKGAKFGSLIGGRTPIWSLVISRNLHLLIPYLVRRCHLDPNEWVTGWLPPLQVAAYMGQGRCIEALLEVGADLTFVAVVPPLSQTAAEVAVFHNHPSCLKVLLEAARKQKKLEQVLHRTDRENTNIIELALKHGHMECYSLLLNEYSTDDIDYSSVLVYASLANLIAVMKIAIAAGATLNSNVVIYENRSLQISMSAISAACEGLSVDAIELLLGLNVRLDFPANDRLTPLARLCCPTARENPILDGLRGKVLTAVNTPKEYIRTDKAIHPKAVETVEEANKNPDTPERRRLRKSLFERLIRAGAPYLPGQDDISALEAALAANYMDGLMVISEQCQKIIPTRDFLLEKEERANQLLFITARTFLPKKNEDNLPLLHKLSLAIRLFNNLVVPHNPQNPEIVQTYIQMRIRLTKQLLDHEALELFKTNRELFTSTTLFNFYDAKISSDFNIIASRLVLFPLLFCLNEHVICRLIDEGSIMIDEIQSILGEYNEDFLKGLDIMFFNYFSMLNSLVEKREKINVSKQASAKKVTEYTTNSSLTFFSATGSNTQIISGRRFCDEAGIEMEAKTKTDEATDAFSKLLQNGLKPLDLELSNYSWCSGSITANRPDVVVLNRQRRQFFCFPAALKDAPQEFMGRINKKMITGGLHYTVQKGGEGLKRIRNKEPIKLIINGIEFDTQVTCEVKLRATEERLLCAPIRGENGEYLIVPCCYLKNGWHHHEEIPKKVEITTPPYHHPAEPVVEAAVAAAAATSELHNSRSAKLGIRR